jgi:hypothetical protein
MHEPFPACENGRPVRPVRHRLPTDVGTKVDTGAVEHQQRDALMFIARKGWCYWRTRSIVRWHHTVSNMEEKRDYAVG